MQNPHGKSVFDMDANIVAMFCYLGNLVCMLGLILSIITVITEKTNKLARFHAWQSILLTIVPIVSVFLLLILFFVGSFLGIIVDSAIGFPIVTIIVTILSFVFYFLLIISGLILFVGQIIAAVKAASGELFKLPVVGKMADKYSG